MSGFFSKLFGGKKKDGNASASDFVENLMLAVLDQAGLQLDVAVSVHGQAPEEDIHVELTGPDADLLTEKEGALLDSFQLFCKRALQHQMADSRANLSFDSNGYRDESNRELVELAESSKEKALEEGRAVYLRALAPRDRKVIHQHLATDERVRSRSIGDGLFKKIKVYPARMDEAGNADGNGRGRGGPRRQGGGGNSPRAKADADTHSNL